MGLLLGVGSTYALVKDTYSVRQWITLDDFSMLSGAAMHPVCSMLVWLYVDICSGNG
jgi:hypothetical protein